MSRMLAPDSATFTACPGSPVYMPPESLNHPPNYTAKLDCFSFGVLAIQIMTRQYPDPGPQECTVEDTRSPIGTSKIPVLEPERRKSHINLIVPSHPLLSLAIRCLHYSDRDRPSAHELCEQLEILKGGPRYKKSLTQMHNQASTEACKPDQQLQEQIRIKDGVIAACCKQVKTLRQQVEDKDRQLQEISQCLQANESDFQQVLLQREEEIKQLRDNIAAIEGKRTLEGVPNSATPVDTIELKWKPGAKPPKKVRRGSSAVSSDGMKAYFAWENNVYEYTMRGDQWWRLPQCPNKHAGIVVVKGLLTAVGGEVNDATPKPVSTKDLFSLTTNREQHRWTKHYPPMYTKRSSPAVVCSGNWLIVAGGRGDGTTCTVAVEVMDTSSRQWFTASSLLHYFNVASATLCGDTLYLMGGFSQRDTRNGSLSVLTCSLTTLLESRHSHSRFPRLKGRFAAEQPDSQVVWKKAVDAPVYFTTCTTLCGRVIAVGGNQKSSWYDSDPTDNVYQYDPTKKTWTVISHIPTPRYNCLVVNLRDNIWVVGGVDQNGCIRGIVEVGFGDHLYELVQ